MRSSGMALIMSTPGPIFTCGASEPSRIFMDMPLIAPPDISMPISFMVSSGLARRGGTGAAIPAAGASVARAMPERSIVSAAIV